MRSALLPRIRAWAAYRKLFRRARVWRPAIRAVCARHGIPARRLDATFPGTCIVFLADRRRIVKMFPPMVAGDCAVEAAALGAARRAGIPAPRVVARGVLADRVAWPYLILDPVPGRPIREVEDRIPRRDRLAIMESLGRIVRRMHRLRVRLARVRSGRTAEFRRTPELLRCWKHRIRDLTAAALSAYRRAGVFPPALMRDLARRLPRLVRPAAAPRLVHADLNEDHVLVARSRGRWALSGIIDFADALSGDPMYEWMPLWLGLMDRDPELLRAFLRGYAPGARRTEAWRDRAAAFILVHVYGPPTVLSALKRDRVATRRLDWAGLRDRLRPPEVRASEASSNRPRGRGGRAR